jgi:hypothetical protein
MITFQFQLRISIVLEKVRSCILHICAFYYIVPHHVLACSASFITGYSPYIGFGPHFTHSKDKDRLLAFISLL